MADSRAPHPNAPTHSRLPRPVAPDQLHHRDHILAFVVTEARTLAAAFSMRAMIEGHTTIARGDKERRPVECLAAVIANVVKQGDGHARRLWCHNPANQADGVGSAAFERLPGEAIIGRSAGRPAWTGPSQPA